jgi:hypothetical protein
VVEFHRRGSTYCLRYPGLVDFFFDGEETVFCFSEPQTPVDVIQSLVLGPLLAVLLELRGTVCLHASAVQTGKTATAFAGPSGSGKSTLIAGLVDRGFPLVADDVLPLVLRNGRCFAVPGYPQVRLSEDVVHGIDRFASLRGKSLVGDKTLMAVGGEWGCFAPDPVPLRVVYLLGRMTETQGVVEIERLSSRNALVELLRFGFCSRLASALGLAAPRFATLGEIVRSISVRRLRYANHLAQLPEVLNRLSADLDFASTRMRSCDK